MCYKIRRYCGKGNKHEDLHCHCRCRHDGDWMRTIAHTYIGMQLVEKAQREQKTNPLFESHSETNIRNSHWQLTQPRSVWFLSSSSFPITLRSWGRELSIEKSSQWTHTSTATHTQHQNQKCKSKRNWQNAIEKSDGNRKIYDGRSGFDDGAEWLSRCLCVCVCVLLFTCF